MLQIWKIWHQQWWLYLTPKAYLCLADIAIQVAARLNVYVSTNWYLKYTLGKKGCYTPGWCVFFVIISISSVREV